MELIQEVILLVLFLIFLNLLQNLKRLQEQEKIKPKKKKRYMGHCCAVNVTAVNEYIFSIQ